MSEFQKINISDFNKYMQNCPVCGSELKTIPAGISKKTGKPYQSFTTCPKGCKTSWNNSSPQTQNSPAVNQNAQDGSLILAEEISQLRTEINGRLDKLAEYLKSKFN